VHTPSREDTEFSPHMHSKWHGKLSSEMRRMQPPSNMNSRPQKMLICQPMELHSHGTRSAAVKSFASYTTDPTRYCVSYHPCLSNYNF
jgi:hypothetical protein